MRLIRFCSLTQAKLIMALKSIENNAMFYESSDVQSEHLKCFLIKGATFLSGQKLNVMDYS